MRVVQLRRGRVLKLVGVAGVAVVGLVLMYRQYSGHPWSPDTGGGADTGLGDGGDLGDLQPARHQSHPGVKPVFLGKGSKGNYEPAEYGADTRRGTTASRTSCAWSRRARRRS